MAVPVPLPQLFDYLPPGAGSVIAPGTRVVVPFGRGRRVGIVVAEQTGSAIEPERLVAIDEALDDGLPLFDAALMRLLEWCWHYYKHAPGDVLSTALPPSLRRRDGVLPAAPLQYRVTNSGREALGAATVRGTARRSMLALLADQPCEEGELSLCGGSWRRSLRSLLDAGWVSAGPLAAQPLSITAGPELNDEQRQAVDAIGRTLGGFACHLLDGVTGSGKTEIYLQLTEQVLLASGQVLVLVPEIGLTPQLLSRFRARLGFQPAALHSGLSSGERLAAWDAARRGRARLVIGTRSALFCPMPDLRLMILDEEHDASFRQHEGFRYSARDVAVKRAADLGIPVVLGSATPSLESLSNAQQERYRHHRLTQRATRAALPEWRVLDLRHQRAEHGLTAASLEAMAAALERGEQVMVFLNRRGYAPLLMCGECGWHAQCDRCDAHLIWHRSIGRLVCHHCTHLRQAPEFCPACRADALSGIGEGTQRLEDSLQQRFAKHPVLRFDRDATARKDAFNRRIERVIEGQPCLLVGTQMLAKGHHFPAVTLVVVVNVDQALYSADFRAVERLGQTLTQVAGRAGRADRAGTVILQTHHPDNATLQHLIRAGYGPFAESLLAERRLAGLPPASFQILLRAEAPGRGEVEEFLESALKRFPAGAAQAYGPLPALMERVKGRHRMYLMAQSPDRRELHRQVDAWRTRLLEQRRPLKVRWAFDVDPQEL